MKTKLTNKEKLKNKIEFLEELGKTRSKSLITRATKWELQFLSFLKRNNIKFYFQVPVVVNKLKAPQLFILDFVLQDNTIVEIDSIKYHGSKEQVKADNRRTKLLRKEGYSILRLYNAQIEKYSEKELLEILQIRVSPPTILK